MNNKVNERLIWLNGELINVNDAKVNILSPTSQFGLNVFEGIRCYWNENDKNLYAFRLDDHFKRLKKSQRLLELEDKYSVKEMKKAFFEVIKANEYKEDIAVRQTLFVEGFGTWHSSERVGMFIAPIPKKRIDLSNENGLRCCISSWKRISDNSISPRIKCGANYINSRMAHREALRNGYDTAIILNEQGKVSEGPGSCIFIVREGKLITPSLTDSILESITRDTIITIAKEVFNIEVIERSIDRTELYMCEEAFLCGSAMEIRPIGSVDKQIINSGNVGDLTSILREYYLRSVVDKKLIFSELITSIY